MAEAPRTVTPAEKAQEQERAAAQELDANAITDTESVPGGAYIVGDELVDAEGKPIKGRSGGGPESSRRE